MILFWSSVSTLDIRISPLDSRRQKGSWILSDVSSINMSERHPSLLGMKYTQFSVILLSPFLSLFLSPSLSPGHVIYSGSSCRTWFHICLQSKIGERVSLHKKMVERNCRSFLSPDPFSPRPVSPRPLQGNPLQGDTTVLLSHTPCISLREGKIVRVGTNYGQ